jgi:hypothetical protein
VAAVVAFSPGEYFGSTVAVKDWLADYDQLLYVATTRVEYPFVSEIVQPIPENQITRFQPDSGGVQGASALSTENLVSSEYWVSLMLFLNRIKEIKF